jgi:hypothetical protein
MRETLCASDAMLASSERTMLESVPEGAMIAPL